MNSVAQGAVARERGVLERATAVMAFAAAALLVLGTPGIARGTPPTCADVLKSIEKRLADAGVRHPPLKIVPKNLASGYRVVGTCEGGTQRIVHDIEAPASRSDAGKKMAKP